MGFVLALFLFFLWFVMTGFEVVSYQHRMETSSKNNELRIADPDRLQATEFLWEAAPTLNSIVLVSSNQNLVLAASDFLGHAFEYRFFWYDPSSSIERVFAFAKSSIPLIPLRFDRGFVYFPNASGDLVKVDIRTGVQQVFDRDLVIHAHYTAENILADFFPVEDVLFYLRGVCGGDTRTEACDVGMYNMKTKISTILMQDIQTQIQPLVSHELRLRSYDSIRGAVHFIDVGEDEGVGVAVGYDFSVSEKTWRKVETFSYAVCEPDGRCDSAAQEAQNRVFVQEVRGYPTDCFGVSIDRGDTGELHLVSGDSTLVLRDEEFVGCFSGDLATAGQE